MIPLINDKNGQKLLGRDCLFEVYDNVTCTSISIDIAGGMPIGHVREAITNAIHCLVNSFGSNKNNIVWSYKCKNMQESNLEKGDRENRGYWKHLLKKMQTESKRGKKEIS